MREDAPAQTPIAADKDYFARHSRRRIFLYVSAAVWSTLAILLGLLGPVFLQQPASVLWPYVIALVLTNFVLFYYTEQSANSAAMELLKRIKKLEDNPKEMSG